jgi:hypothetical protein
LSNQRVNFARLLVGVIDHVLAPRAANLDPLETKGVDHI